RSTGLLGRPLKRSNGEESSRCARWPRWRRIGVSGSKAASPRLRVDQGRNAPRGCSDVSQRQAGSVGAVCEQRLPSPEDDWVNHEPILVNQPALDERVEDLATAVDQQVAARLVLQPLNSLSEIALEQPSVPLERLF